jgi:hypothetical protein
MLQRFAQLCVALAEFLEQAHVFYRDHRLVGEGFKKRDLLGGERLDCQSSNEYHSNRKAFSKQRYSQKSTDAVLLSQSPGIGKFFPRLCAGYVMNVDGLTVDHGSGRDEATNHRPSFAMPRVWECSV